MVDYYNSEEANYYLGKLNGEKWGEAWKAHGRKEQNPTERDYTRDGDMSTCVRLWTKSVLREDLGDILKEQGDDKEGENQDEKVGSRVVEN